MADVFISHDTSDQVLVHQLAEQLEQEGITSWYYERDSVPGPSHITQTGKAISAAKATLVVISFHSVRSFEVNTEVEWTYSEHKSFVPVLVGISWAQFLQEKKQWQQLMGLVAGIEVIPENLPPAVSRIVMGLKQLGIEPRQAPPRLETQQIYLKAVRAAQASPQGILGERPKLDYLREFLRISDDEIVRLEAQVREEYAQEQQRLAEQELERREQEQRRLHEQLEKRELQERQERERREREEQTSDIGNKNLIPVWQEPAKLGHPAMLAALFHDPLHTLVADETGLVLIYDEGKHVRVRERVSKRPWHVATLTDRVILSAWGGGLYCFGATELLWNVELNSPAAALCPGDGGMLAVGTWDGQLCLLTTDGKVLWRREFADALSAVGLMSSRDLVAAATYSGQLELLNLSNQVVTQLRFETGIVQLGFTTSGDLVVATRAGLLQRIRFSEPTPVTLWTYDLRRTLADFYLSQNEHRLVAASTRGELLMHRINGGLQPEQEHIVSDLAGVVMTPLFSDGHLILAASRREGLVWWDQRHEQPSIEIREPVTCLACSGDGRRVLVGGMEGAQLYRLARADVYLQLAPLTQLRAGEWGRVRVEWRNRGERTARSVRVEVEGPCDFKFAEPPDHLQPGETISVDDNTLRPIVSGALPLQVSVTCQDDWGIHHTAHITQVLDVSGDKI